MTTPSFIVTAIREHPKRRGRFTIEVDGEDSAVVGLDSIADLRLTVGEPVDDRSRRRLAVANRRTALLDKALNLLAVRARSSRDMRLRLRRAPSDDRDIRWVIDRLGALGYVDDAAYARQVARTRIVGGGTSKRRVQDELYRRGIPREVASAAIEAVLAEGALDEYGAALVAARKRLPSLSKLDAPTRRRRLYA